MYRENYVMWYDNLENKRLWSIFEEIEQIPRESGNEEGVRQYLLKWGKEHNLETIVDKVGNVIMKCPATEGLEGLPSIALQGHMDMVCVKRDGSNHDFTKDPIEVVEENGIIRAKDTSLGADNGIAIALILDIFSDPDAKHGKLEGIFTVAEETGLTGAFGIDASLIESKRLLNLDSEEEGIFYIGCAGGIEIDAEMHVNLKVADGEFAATVDQPDGLTKFVNDGKFLRVVVSGLLGGHSGGEIHKERANAINVLARYLNRLPEYNIAAISGGTRRNVIPSHAEAIIQVRDTDSAISLAKNLLEELKGEYKLSDPGINLAVTPCEPLEKVIDRRISSRIADLLFTSPVGVQAMSLALEGVVETSDNLAIVEMEGDTVKVIWSVRSSVESAKLNLAYKIQTLAEGFGFKTVLSGGYPSWQPNPKSKFTKEVAAAYKKYTGKKPVITAIHAGLECGIINKAVEGMDSLSIGPNLFDVHSVNEHVEAKSAERIAAFVKNMLKDVR